MSSLLALTSNQLMDLAAGLSSGGLAPPYDVAGLKGRVGAECAPAVARELVAFAADGMAPHQLASVASLLAAKAKQLEVERDRIELVWTGPDEQGAATRDTSVVARELFGEAEREVLVATYAIYDGKKLFEVLARRMLELPDLHVTIVADIRRRDDEKSASSDSVVARWSEQFWQHHWPGERRPKLYFDPRTLTGEKSVMHAKCIVVDRRRCLITSANFTDAAQQRNIELGVKLDDKQLSRALATKFFALIENRTLASCG